MLAAELIRRKRYGGELSAAELDQLVAGIAHPTGGVGDKVSLLLAPIVAACGRRGANDFGALLEVQRTV